MKRIAITLLMALFTFTSMAQNEGAFMNAGIGAGFPTNSDYGNTRNGVVGLNAEAGYEWKDFGLQAMVSITGIGHDENEQLENDYFDSHTQIMLGSHWMFKPGSFFLKIGSGIGIRSSSYEFPSIYKNENFTESALTGYLKFHPGFELGDSFRLGWNTIYTGEVSNSMLSIGTSF